MPSLSDDSNQAQQEQIPTETAFFETVLPQEQTIDLHIAPLQEATTSQTQDEPEIQLPIESHLQGDSVVHLQDDTADYIQG